MPFHKGNKINLGRKFSETHKKNMSEVRKNKNLGENSPNWKGGKIKRICIVCGKIFYKDKNELKNGYGKFCSAKCMGKWWSKNRRGKNGANWKGGITPEMNKKYNSEEWIKIRKKVYKRDKWICQRCGLSKCKINAHHIIPYRISKSNKLKNLITLCSKCHRIKEMEGQLYFNFTI